MQTNEGFNNKIYMISFHIATKDEKHNILALMQKIYPTYNYNNAFFEWEYLQNPVGKAKIFLAKDGKKVIGKYSLTPHMLVEKGKRFVIWRIQNVMIDPDYRKQGIFFQLMSYAHDLQHWTSKDIFWGFPNEKSFPYFEKYGFESQARYTFWEYEGDSVAESNVQHFHIKSENDFHFLNDELFSYTFKYKKDYLNIVKDERYLTWRYNKKPDTQYEIYTIAENEEIIGYFVLKKYTNTENQISLHICELEIKDNNTAALMFSLNFCIAKKRDYHAFLLNTFLIFPDMQAILENCGFVKKDTTRKVIFLNGLYNNDSIKHKLYFSLGDNDIF